MRGFRLLGLVAAADSFAGPRRSCDVGRKQTGRLSRRARGEVHQLLGTISWIFWNETLLAVSTGSLTEGAGGSNDWRGLRLLCFLRCGMAQFVAEGGSSGEPPLPTPGADEVSLGTALFGCSRGVVIDGVVENSAVSVRLSQLLA
jgi:hypothetical protein